MFRANPELIPGEAGPPPQGGSQASEVCELDKSLPLRHGLAAATAASIVASAAVVVASGVGLGTGAGGYAQSQSVLFSQGADAGNLIVVVLVLAALWFAHHGSLTALLLWPGGLCYLAYAYGPYLIGAPFTPLLFDDVGAFLAAAYGLAALATGIDGTALRKRSRRSGTSRTAAIAVTG